MQVATQAALVSHHPQIVDSECNFLTNSIEHGAHEQSDEAPDFSTEATIPLQLLYE